MEISNWNPKDPVDEYVDQTTKNLIDNELLHPISWLISACTLRPDLASQLFHIPEEEIVEWTYVVDYDEALCDHLEDITDFEELLSLADDCGCADATLENVGFEDERFLVTEWFDSLTENKRDDVLAEFRYDIVRFSNSKSLCEAMDVETHHFAREVLEYWVVSHWLYTELRLAGYKVFELGSLCIWGRTTYGQAVIMDGVIQQIVWHAYESNIADVQAGVDAAWKEATC